MTHRPIPSAAIAALALAGAFASAACSRERRAAPEVRPAPSAPQPAPLPAAPPDGAAAAAPATPAPSQPVAVGQRAPDFALASTEEGGRVMRLADLRGQRTVVLAFFPRAFTPG